MTFVLTGSGIEDARNPLWGHLYRSLVALGHQVSLFDPVSAPDSTKRGEVSQQFEWMLNTRKPERIFLVPTDPTNDEMIKCCAAAANVGVTVLGIDELSGWNNPESVHVNAACHPHVFEVSESPGPRSADVVFNGVASPSRAAILEALVAAKISVVAYGDGWDAYPSLRSYVHGPVAYPLLGNVFSGSKVALALSADDVKSTFAVTGSRHAALEAASCGVAVVSNDLAVESVLNASSEFVMVNDVELVSEVEALLADEELRSAIARAARLRALEQTWESRWMQWVSRAVPKVAVTKEGPLVSVATAIYNIEEYVGEMIESVLAQTVDDWELVIVNDGTPDGSRSVVEKYLSDPRIRLFDQPNIAQTGRFDLLWRSIEENARGEYFSHIGGDDIASPRRLELQLNAFQRDPNLDIVHGGCRVVNSQGEPTGTVLSIATSYNSATLLRDEIKQNLIASPSAMTRRSTDSVIGQWAMGFGCDYHFWLKAADTLRFRYIPETLVNYRVHDKSASTSPSGSQDSRSEALRLRQRERDRHVIADLYPPLRWANEATDRDWAAAYLDLGMAFCVGVDTAETALEHFEMAARLLGNDVHEGVYANMAYPLFLLGRTSEAEALLARSGEFAAGVLAESPLLFDPVHLSTLPFTIPKNRADEVIWWDGTPYSQTRIMLLVDWMNPATATYVLDRYMNDFAGIDNIELVLPTLGHSEDDVVAQLMPILPKGVDLENGPDITIESYERIDYIALDRYTAVIDCLSLHASRSLPTSLAALQSLAAQLRPI